MRVAFIGFGEAGQAFAATLAEAGHTLSAYDILCADPVGAPLAARAAALGVTFEASLAGALSGAEVVISAVTAAASLEAVAFAPLARGQVLVDINSVSPGRKRATAGHVRGHGAGYVDMAVMGPVHPHGHRTPVLVAGDVDAALLDGLGFAHETAGPEPGEATAVKMIRSLFVKGLEAITVQTLAAASAAGLSERISHSLSRSYPGLGWPDHAGYTMERVTTHGARRAAEMEECAVTLAEAGFAEGAALARAIAGLQRAAAGPGAPGPDPDAAAAAIAHRLKR